MKALILILKILLSLNKLTLSLAIKGFLNDYVVEGQSAVLIQPLGKGNHAMHQCSTRPGHRAQQAIERVVSSMGQDARDTCLRRPRVLQDETSDSECDQGRQRSGAPLHQMPTVRGREQPQGSAGEWYDTGETPRGVPRFGKLVRWYIQFTGQWRLVCYTCADDELSLCVNSVM